ncbi:hypothetical protein [Streptomyces virginiae]|uniref:hypothetical protein n=1 Tax=Streptomyces virginiae TaxID=1961 RepID=UPI00225B68F7|nr:hypothetical protein [Streptomyces virginiae]MCX4960616.1 flavodoxin domain-containing protein [Streptomyces virginiae]
MTQKSVLVAYGSKHGATAGIASQIGRTLREDGLPEREDGLPEQIRSWAHHISAELTVAH